MMRPSRRTISPLASIDDWPLSLLLVAFDHLNEQSDAF
jgi:hypothetical protein